VPPNAGLRRVGPIAAIVLFTLAAFPSDAFAYVDPGTGSVVLQILVAGALGAALTVRQWWAKAVSLLQALFLRGPGKK
jgi:hypothetical protein